MAKPFLYGGAKAQTKTTANIRKSIQTDLQLSVEIHANYGDCVPNERYTHVGKLSAKQLARTEIDRKTKISLVFAFRLPTQTQ